MDNFEIKVEIEKVRHGWQPNVIATINGKPIPLPDSLIIPVFECKQTAIDCAQKLPGRVYTIMSAKQRHK